MKQIRQEIEQYDHYESLGGYSYRTQHRINAKEYNTLLCIIRIFIKI